MSCSDLVEIEAFPSADMAEARVHQAIHDGADAKMVEMLQREVEWRKCRQSPPRCLRCYSEDAIPIDEIIGFVHPECGGTIEDGEEPCMHYSTDYTQYLTTEGLPYDIDCLKRVALFVSQFTGMPVSSFTADTFLERDLEVTGAKAIQLITSFGQEFNIELSSFHYLNHFKPISRLGRFTAPNEDDPISLRRMARAVHIGKWV